MLNYPRGIKPSNGKKTAMNGFNWDSHLQIEEFPDYRRVFTLGSPTKQASWYGMIWYDPWCMGLFKW